MNAIEELKLQAGHLSDELSSAYLFGSGAFGLTQYTVWMFICMALVLLVVLLASRRLTKIPNGRFVSMVEYGYSFVRKDIAEGVIGHGYKKHVPLLATIFFFILISNFVGLIPGCDTPTGTISITWVLALTSFVYFIFWGVKTHGVFGYLKSFAPSGLPVAIVPLIWVIEFVSTIMRALTLAVRLYGNMFAGHIVLGIFALATSIFIGEAAIMGGQYIMALPGLAWVLFLVAMFALETLVAFLQAYVFTILSAVYISLATSDH